MTIDGIKTTVQKSKLFNCTINPSVSMWELDMEDADFPIKHTVYLYVNHEGTHLVGGYLSVDLAADKLTNVCDTITLESLNLSDINILYLCKI